MTKPSTFAADLNPYLIVPVDLRARIATELKEKNRLQHRRGYLHRYNYAIRLMLLHYLERGMDVRQDKIHPAFRHFIAEIMGYGHQTANALIQARHRLKYHGVEVDKSVMQNLNEILEVISRNLKVDWG